MEEKKTFFESLSPKSALIIGGVAGLLVLCTIGFFVMIGMYFSNRSDKNDSLNTAKAATAIDGAQKQATSQEQAPKTDKPVVELFVMSHCPYGLQMEKAYLPAWNLLKNKADISIKFVNYSMHGLREVQEETRQLCVAEKGQDTYMKYLNCFVLADEPEACLTASGLNQKDITTCSDRIDKKYGIMKSYNDKASWLSGRFPIFPAHEDLNKKYEVQGSPTLVINGTQINAGRSPEEVKQAICAAFKTAPEECKQTLSTTSASPSFGESAGGATASGSGCGA